MKFGITKYELFATTSHLAGIPSPSPEYSRRRLQAWDMFGVSGLAESLTTGAAMGGEIQLTEWRDKTTMHLIDLTPEILVHVIAGITPDQGRPTAGMWTDTLTRLRERLEQLRDKIYELPEELRLREVG